MRQVILGVVVVIALIAGALPAGGQQQVYALHVDGLACPFCAYGIEKELSGLEAVEKLEIDINRGVVLVTLAEGASVTEALFIKAVDNAGFTLREVEETTRQQKAQ